MIGIEWKNSCNTMVLMVYTGNLEFNQNIF